MNTGCLPSVSDITGYSFRDPQILKRALTRKAYCQEQDLPEGMHMDALATLGDAVIELHILSVLVREGGCDKGEINGEKRNHIWTSGRVLAECIEALIGAVFLDGGYDSAGQVMKKIGLTPELSR